MNKEEGENGRDDMFIDDPQQVEDEFNSNYLKFCYEMLFHHEDMSKWMSYGNDGKHPACDQSYFLEEAFIRNVPAKSNGLCDKISGPGGTQNHSSSTGIIVGSAIGSCVLVGLLIRYTKRAGTSFAE